MCLLVSFRTGAGRLCPFEFKIPRRKEILLMATNEADTLLTTAGRLFEPAEKGFPQCTYTLQRQLDFLIVLNTVLFPRIIVK